MGLQLGVAKQGTPVQQFPGARAASPRVKDITVGFATTGFPQSCAFSQDHACNVKLVEDAPTHIQLHS